MMRNRNDDLWSDLKAYAAEYARSERPPPIDEECENWLREALRRHNLTLPSDAFEFYSNELCALIEDYRREAPPRGHNKRMTDHKSAGKREELSLPNETRFRRDEEGHFTADQVDKGESLSRHRKRDAEHEAPKGRGDRGDRRQ